MRERRMPHGRPLTTLWIITLVGMLCAYSSYRIRRGEWAWAWHSAALTDIQAAGGQAFTSTVTFDSPIFEETPVPAVVVEDGLGLSPTRAPLESIRADGRGAYRIDGRQVYFSSTDGGDPRSSGRRYYLWYSPVGRLASRLVYAAALALSALTFAVTLWLLRLREARRYLVDTAASLPSTLRATAQTGAARIDAWIHRGLGRRGAVVSLAGLGITVVLAVVACQAIFVMRSGQWTSLWRMAEVRGIEPKNGLAFRASTGKEIGAQFYPSPAGMFEDGRPLGLRNALHQEIRSVGRGRYSFWYDYVYFTASDNTDPRTNGRRYTFSYPPVSRTAARTIYSATALLIALGLIFAVTILRSGVIGESQARALATLRERAVIIAAILSCASLASIGILRALPATAPLTTPLWTVVMVINVITAALCRVRYGRRLPAWVLGAFTVTVAVCFYTLTLWAPHRSQGCHTSDPLPAWSAFCVAPDSASYYFDYVVGSTRQPLYPWFIDALTIGRGFDPSTYLKTSTPGAVQNDPADPLYLVVHAQIALLLSAAVVAALLVMRWTGTPLAALAFVALYDQQFFSANELNIVLTEPLVQTFMLLAAGMYAAFFTRLRPAALMMAAVCGGLAFLTRQAAAYVIVLLLVMMAVALFEAWRRWLPWCVAALVVFASICAVPDLYTIAKTGRLSRQQDSLQYQYRIARAMQYATAADLDLMPDEATRAWLADSIVRRDRAHRVVAEQYRDDELNRMIYYIASNLYEVATPIDGSRPAQPPEFYMRVATPILKRHLTEYVRFSFRFWQFGVTRPGLTLLGMFGVPAWATYVALFVLALCLRSRNALAALALILAHWGAVAIICLAAVPIPRMTLASEFLVVIAALVLVCDAAVALAAAMTAKWRQPAPSGAVVLPR